MGVTFHMNFFLNNFFTCNQIFSFRKMIKELTSEISYQSFKKEVLEDYKTVCLSRAMSVLGRKEVLTGKV